ncbi:DUF4331 family protein [Flexithrix dorotheae]|uniref:DUF4331 family protein n=1 Tax=Flexithrix dorotheae TaxID=70993 RepID=UPI00037F81FC|nr:DUF4331 family protein [Flexithrix dorotheae]
MNLSKLKIAGIALGMLFLYSCKDDENMTPSLTITPNAGDEKMVEIYDEVALSGSATVSDPNAQVTYQWAFNNVPSGSNATIMDATTLTPSFIPDVEGDYILDFMVKVGDQTMTDMVTVSADDPVFALADQMGRPTINTVFNYFGDADAKNGYNQVIPTEGSANATPFKGILDALQSYIGLDASAYNNVLGLDNSTTSGILAVDVLNCNITAPSTYGPSDLDNPQPFVNVLNGRKLQDDIIDVTLILAFAGNDLSALNDVQKGLISDNVQENDKSFNNEFPYVAAPH